MSDLLQRQDPAVWASLQRESARQRDNIELIASENYVSAAVREVVGSVLTNKYAEGYPGKRYYGGCEAVDAIEVLAIERAKALFGAEHANVQPHAGSSTNAAAYAALLSPGDPVLAMSLAAGGHLTHGAPASLTGTYYSFTHYGVDPDSEQIDYEAVHALAKQCRPKLIVAGITAYPRQVDFARFAEIAGDVGAYLLVDMAHLAGLVAAGLHPSPMPHADVVTTSTHKTLRGPRGGLILCREQHAKAIDRAVFPGLQGGPLMHVIAGKAVAFAEAATPAFGEYQKQVIHNAQALGAGLTHHGFRLVTGGTDTHMLLVDLGATTDALTGKQAERLLDAVHITVNKNAIPRDTRPAAVTSGLRLGSPAVTTRGLREPDMARIADYMAQALSDGQSEADTTRLAEAVRSWISEFPLP